MSVIGSAVVDPNSIVRNTDRTITVTIKDVPVDTFFIGKEMCQIKVGDIVLIGNRNELSRGYQSILITKVMEYNISLTDRSTVYLKFTGKEMNAQDEVKLQFGPMIGYQTALGITFYGFSNCLGEIPSQIQETYHKINHLGVSYTLQDVVTAGMKYDLRKIGVADAGRIITSYIGIYTTTNPPVKADVDSLREILIQYHKNGGNI